MVESARILIVIADRQSLFREAVRAVLEREDGLAVSADVGELTQLVATVERVQADCLLLGLDAAGGGLDCLTRVKEAVAGCRVLAITECEDEGLLVDALRAGADGYISKDAPLAHLIHAVREVMLGHFSIPPSMLGPLIGRLLRHRQEVDESLGILSTLTKREREVLVLLADGFDNHAIGEALVISPQTARTHIQNVLAKLGVHSRLEAAMFVRQPGVYDGLLASAALTPATMRSA